MSNQRILTLYPYLYPGTACWVFDDARTGLKEEAFVEGTSEMITRVVEQKRIPRAAKGFLLSFSDQPFDGYDVERLWLRGDAEDGNWYEGEVLGEYMENWLCPALAPVLREAATAALRPVRSAASRREPNLESAAGRGRQKVCRSSAIVSGFQPQ